MFSLHAGTMKSYSIDGMSALSKSKNDIAVTTQKLTNFRGLSQDFQEISWRYDILSILVHVFRLSGYFFVGESLNRSFRISRNT